MPPDAKLNVVRRSAVGPDRKTAKPKENPWTVQRRNEFRCADILLSLIEAIKDCDDMEFGVEHCSQQLQRAFARFSSKFPIGHGHSVLRAVAEERLESFALSSECDDEEPFEELTTAANSLSIAWGSASPPPSPAPISLGVPGEQEDLQIFVLASRLFLYPLDLEHLPHALSRIPRGKPAAELPCCMIKYPESRDTFTTGLRGRNEFDPSALANGVRAALTTQRSLLPDRRALLHRSLYVHGGQTPGVFAAKLKVFAAKDVHLPLCAQWCHVEIVTAVSLVLETCSAARQQALAELLSSRAPPGCGGEEKYNARWLARALREALHGEQPNFDAGEWGGPVPTSVSARFHPAQLRDFLAPHSVVLQQNMGLLSVVCCFGTCLAARMREEGTSYTELSTLVDKVLAAPCEEYATPERRVFGNRKKRSDAKRRRVE